MRRATVDELDLRSLAGAKVALRVVPASGASARGLTASMVILGEFGHHLEDAEQSRRTAAEVWRAVVPAVPSFGSDARIIVISRPYGDANGRD